MKWTGFGAIACSTLLIVACSADGPNDRDDSADRTVGTSGVGNDDSAARAGDDDSALTGAGSARIGADTEAGQATPGSRTNAGQAEHGATGDARHFAEKAAYAGNAEVKLGQLAAERAQDPAVKEFAQMMIRDHSKAGNELKQAVKAHDVNTPAGLDAEHQQLYDRLSRLRGAEFDREYMKAMVDGHAKVKSMVADRANQRGAADRNRATGTSGRAATSTQLDTAVNQWASKSLPTVEQHLQKAQDLQGKVSGHTGGARH